MRMVRALGLSTGYLSTMLALELQIRNEGSN